MASSRDLNPMSGLYRQFQDVLENLTIKYTYTAADNETIDTKKYADRYLDAINKRDNFYTYSIWEKYELTEIGIEDYHIISEVLAGNNDVLPIAARELLVENRRNRIIYEYEEQNEYYRIYNGLAPKNALRSQYFYLPEDYANWIGLPEEDRNIPIHMIQDYFNKQDAGLGDYYIMMLEGTNYIEELIQANPDIEYLKYMGSNRISIKALRGAKNFQIIQLKGAKLSTVMYDTFLQVYEQCRDYVVKVIYNSFYRQIIPYYDNFIALSIMVMTINNMVMSQIPLGIRREYYNKAAIQALYQAYGIPYNLMLDEETQSNIVQNLNLMIQHKATDKVIYDIANLLGFSKLDVYKYYLVKEQKFDRYGVPIVKWTERFNTDTGEFETTYDYEKMYDKYFQKAELRNQNYVESLTHPENRVEYDIVTTNDPYWYEDTDLVNAIYNTKYNFVETKYLSLSIAYSMTEIIFDNTVLLKMILHNKETINNINLELPKITNNRNPVPLFDVVVLLLAITAAKHELTGEIITKPSQVISILDYNQNLQDSELLVDTLSFDFSLFHPNNEKGRKLVEEMKEVLSERDYEEFVSYLSCLNIDNNLPNKEKIAMFNQAYSDIKNLYYFLEHQMSKTTDHKTYEILKRLYHAAYYSQEMADIFMIRGNHTGFERPAKTYFEYLYYTNPKLYGSIFETNLSNEHRKYLEANGLTVDDISYDEFVTRVELGEIEVFFDTMKDITIDDTDAKDEKIYYYVNHIIDKLNKIVHSVDYLNILLEMGSPLEELLLKLVRFFKSYTIDVLNLDHIYTCDLKNENFLKMIDHIDYMLKIEQVREDLNLNHSDVMPKIEILFDVLDKMKFKDWAMYESWLTLINDGDKRNGITPYDALMKISKIIQLTLNTTLHDSYQMTTNLHLSSNTKLRDKVYIKWVDE